MADGVVEHKLFLGKESKGRVDIAFANYMRENCTKLQGQYCNCDLQGVCNREGSITDYVAAEEMLISAGFLTELPE